MSTRTQNRQPAGVPVGGQFATTSRPEPEVALSGAEIETLTDSYLESALFSTSNDAGDESLLADYSVEDVDDAAREQATDDIEGFFEANAELIARAKDADRGYSDRQVAHDFWLTRNGHGAGFWDRGLGEVGDELTQVAKAYGSADLYVGDDGKIHLS